MCDASSGVSGWLFTHRLATTSPTEEEQGHERDAGADRQSSIRSASNPTNMSAGTFVDRIDPFAKRSIKKKSKKSQGSSRYRNSQDVELQQLPQLKGN